MIKGIAFWQATLLSVSLLAGGFAAAAGLYKWVDGQGNVHYTQDPPPQGSFKALPPPPPAPETPAAVEQKPAQAQDTQTSTPLANSDAEEKKRQAVADKQNCDVARKNLEIYTRYRRVVNEKGEVVMLDDNERRAKIKEAEEMIKKSCK